MDKYHSTTVLIHKCYLPKQNWASLDRYGCNTNSFTISWEDIKLTLVFGDYHLN